MKLRSTNPFMTADEYGRSLEALTVNLLVRDIDAALRFQRDVLRAQVVYADPDFAVVRGYGAEWMIHANHTYQGQAMEGVLAGPARRGVGVELRLHGCDPDAAEAAARAGGYQVLAGAVDKGHGLREAYLADPDG